MKVVIEVEKNGKTYSAWSKTEKIFASTIGSSIEKIKEEILTQIKEEYPMESIFDVSIIPSNTQI